MAIKDTKQPVQPKIIWKGHEEYRHDLFKLEPANCKTNQSYQRGIPQIMDVTHSHHFHSVDRAGKPCKYASMASGHTHEIKVTVLDDGSMRATCGPAVREKKTKLGRSGKTKTEFVSISYDDDANDAKIEDNHTHEVTYKFSEVVSQAQLKAQQQQDGKRLGDMMGTSTRLSSGNKPELLERGEE